jgi:hypothetical protein
LGRMHNYFLSLLIWFPFVSQSPHPLTYACYHLGRKCCHQDSAFPYLLFLCRLCHQGMYPQLYHIFGTLPW